MRCIEYMRMRYAETQFGFFLLPELQNRFGAGVREELNALAHEGLIRKREGIGSTIVEYIFSNDKQQQNEQVD